MINKFAQPLSAVCPAGRHHSRRLYPATVASWLRLLRSVSIAKQETSANR